MVFHLQLQAFLAYQQDVWLRHPAATAQHAVNSSSSTLMLQLLWGSFAMGSCLVPHGLHSVGHALESHALGFDGLTPFPVFL